jgi:hypothetical protein
VHCAQDSNSDSCITLSKLIPWWLSSLACFPWELIWNYGPYRQLVGLLGRGISPSQGRYLRRTTQTQEHPDIHPCLEWDSNSRSQCLSGRSYFVPYILRPLRRCLFIIPILHLVRCLVEVKRTVLSAYEKICDRKILYFIDMPILSRDKGDYRRVLNWWLDLFDTHTSWLHFTHHYHTQTSVFNQIAW